MKTIPVLTSILGNLKWLIIGNVICLITMLFLLPINNLTEIEEKILLAFCGSIAVASMFSFVFIMIAVCLLPLPEKTEDNENTEE
ncbi:MAG: hypothetical protein WCT16_02455 [Candidatus Buchananbacteria bacterium]